MRLLIWYCDGFGWNPAMKTLEAHSMAHEKAIGQKSGTFLTN